MNKKGNKFLKALIIFLILSTIFGGPFSLLMGVFGFGIFGVALGLIIWMIVKLVKNKGYVEPEKDTRQSKNPYSVGNENANLDFTKTTSYANGSIFDQEARRIENQSVSAPTGYNRPAAQTVSRPVMQVETVPSNVKPIDEVLARKSTGNKEIDKMIEDRDKAISEMHRLNDAIEDEKISAQIDHLEAVTNKIVDYIIAHPKKKKQVHQFFDYYLPTTLKLLNAYDRADDTGISGVNIDGTKGKVEDMMDTALDAFDKQLDALFADEAMDVSTEIDVFESMLKAEGLNAEDEISKYFNKKLK